MMSKFNVSLGKWLGIPVYLHWSWLLMLLLVLLISPKFAIVFVGVFGLVLLHELGHCVAGKYYNMPVVDIILFPFGGAARMEISQKPLEEVVLALAGPAVNLALMLPLAVLGQYNGILAILGYYNIVLLIFNLIPAFPMDGGRVLRAVLHHFLKDYAKATLIAGRIGQFVAGGFFFIGIFARQFMLSVIGLFVWAAAEAEIRNAKQKQMQSPSPNSLVDVNDIRRRVEEITRKYQE